jgi:hypothetical protein
MHMLRRVLMGLIIAEKVWMHKFVHVCVYVHVYCIIYIHIPHYI